MDSSALRLDLINRIQNSVGDHLLHDIARLIKADESYDKISFSNDQKELIQKSMRQYEDGKVLTDNVAENDIQKWLKN